jgi:hypothetical protein
LGSNRFEEFGDSLLISKSWGYFGEFGDSLLIFAASQIRAALCRSFPTRVLGKSNIHISKLGFNAFLPLGTHGTFLALGDVMKNNFTPLWQNFLIFIFGFLVLACDEHTYPGGSQAPQDQKKNEAKNENPKTQIPLIRQSISDAMEDPSGNIWLVSKRVVDSSLPRFSLLRLNPHGEVEREMPLTSATAMTRFTSIPHSSEHIAAVTHEHVSSTGDLEVSAQIRYLSWINDRPVFTTAQTKVLELQGQLDRISESVANVFSPQQARLRLAGIYDALYNSQAGLITPKIFASDDHFEIYFNRGPYEALSVNSVTEHENIWNNLRPFTSHRSHILCQDVSGNFISLTSEPEAPKSIEQEDEPTTSLTIVRNEVAEHFAIPAANIELRDCTTEDDHLWIAATQFARAERARSTAIVIQIANSQMKYTDLALDNFSVAEAIIPYADGALVSGHFDFKQADSGSVFTPSKGFVTFVSKDVAASAQPFVIEAKRIQFLPVLKKFSKENSVLVAGIQNAPLTHDEDRHFESLWKILGSSELENLTQNINPIRKETSYEPHL